MFGGYCHGGDWCGIYKRIKEKEEEERMRYKKDELYSKGTFNVKQFIEAGDYLISKYPYFRWNGSSEDYDKKILPENKKYLSTTVYLYESKKEYLKKNEITTTEKILDGDWVDISLKDKKNKMQQILEKYKQYIKYKKDDKFDDENFIIKEDFEIKDDFERKDDCKIKDDCEIDDDFIIEDDFERKDDCKIKEDCEIEDDCEIKIMCLLILRKKLKKEEYKNKIKDQLQKSSDKAIYKACCLPDNQFFGIIKYIYEKNPKKKVFMTFDISITYDLYYKVPKISFIGYNNKGILLREREEMGLDFLYHYSAIVSDINWNTNEKCYSIHPCRTSNLILKIIDILKRNNDNFEVGDILILFLKITMQNLFLELLFDLFTIKDK